MPNYNARKRLKKKMLDRWENEGGRIGADSMIAGDSNPVSKSENADNRVSASRRDLGAGVGKPAVRGKKRQLTPK